MSKKLHRSLPPKFSDIEVVKFCSQDCLRVLRLLCEDQNVAQHFGRKCVSNVGEAVSNVLELVVSTAGTNISPYRVKTEDRVPETFRIGRLATVMKGESARRDERDDLTVEEI